MTARVREPDQGKKRNRMNVRRHTTALVRNTAKNGQTTQSQTPQYTERRNVGALGRESVGAWKLREAVLRRQTLEKFLRYVKRTNGAKTTGEIVAVAAYTLAYGADLERMQGLGDCTPHQFVVLTVNSPLCDLEFKAGTLSVNCRLQLRRTITFPRFCFPISQSSDSRPYSRRGLPAFINRSISRTT